MKLKRLSKATKTVNFDDAKITIRPLTRSLVLDLQAKHSNMNSLEFEKDLMRALIVSVDNIESEGDLIECIIDYQELVSFILNEAAKFNDELRQAYDNELKN